MPDPVRRCARLLIVDDDDRLLLFRHHDEHRSPFWATPGGELVADETYAEAAARELREETGFDAPVGAALREREATYAVARSTPARWHETYFVVRVAGSPTPRRDDWTPEERDTIRAWRWWSATELRTSDETFLPDWIPDALDDVIAAR